MTSMMIMMIDLLVNITVDPKESPRRTELRDYDKMLVEMYEGSIKSTFDNPKRTALETAKAFHYGELIDEIYESCGLEYTGNYGVDELKNRIKVLEEKEN